MPLDSVVKLLAKRLQAIYGERVRLQFVDITREEEQARYPGIWQQVAEGLLNLPTVAIGDKLVTSGVLELDPLVGALEQLAGLKQAEERGS